MFSTGHRGVLGRAHRGYPVIWGGQEKGDVPLGCQVPRSAHPRSGWPNADVPPGASLARAPWAPLPQSGAKLAPSRRGVPAGKGSRAGPAGSRALGPGCKLGAFSAPFGSPGRSWKLVTTLLCKGAWKRGRAEETGAGWREGEERLAGIRGGHGEDGEPCWQCPSDARRQSPRGALPRCAGILCGALEPFPFVPTPDLEAKG